jgi:hypothetical protein
MSTTGTAAKERQPSRAQKARGVPEKPVTSSSQRRRRDGKAAAAAAEKAEKTVAAAASTAVLVAALSAEDAEPGSQAGVLLSL